MEEAHGRDAKRCIIAVAVIFDRDGKVLLTQRNQPGSPNTHKKWQLPGGGIEHTEHPLDAIRREIQEEIGSINVKLFNQPYVFSVVRPAENEHIIGLAYPAKYISGEIDISKDPETGGFQWAREKDIDDANSLEEIRNIVHNTKLVQS